MISKLQNNQPLAHKLQKVGEAFNISAPFFSYEEIFTGNVNQTYKVNYVREDENGMVKIKSYLVQKVNTFAFKDPVALMNNIDLVTEYIRDKYPDRTNLHFHHTKADRKTYLFDEDGFWRICNYVPSVTFDTCDNLKVVRNAGEAFGDFQNSLGSFDASKLTYTIPNFHNTRKRYEKLIQDVVKDPKGRVSEVRQEIEWLLSVQDKACVLTDMQEKGQLPLRVTHNDTKINNVLFDEENLDAIVVIDLDTVMPGLVGHDFGDAIRFAANYVEEDCTDYDKAGVDLNIFWAFAEGFLSRTANNLTDSEIDTLAISGFVLACELATRFLDDYLVGDLYFNTRYPGHNLTRARCQVALAKDMLIKLDAMDAIVKSCVKKYKSK